MNNPTAAPFLRRHLPIPLLILILGLAACARRNEADFEEVSDSIRERTGAEVRRTRDEETRALALSRVTQLLSEPLDADGAVQVALLNNRMLQARFEKIGLARAEVIQAGLAPNPLLHAGYRSGDDNEGDPVIEIALVQNVLELLTLPTRRRIALDELESVKAGVAGDILSLASEVRAQFVAVQSDEHILSLMKDSILAARAATETSARLLEAGNITALDHARTRAIEARARLDTAAAELAAMKERERLNILMGLWGDQVGITVSPGPPELPDDEMPMENIESRAVEANFTLAAMRHDLDAAARSAGLTRATALVPEFELGAEFSREEDGSRLLGPTAGLALPLFDQGAPRVRSAEGRLRALEENYWQKGVEIRASARAARDHLVFARRRVGYSRDVDLPLAAEILARSRTEYDGMQIGLFHLLEARENELRAGRRYISDLREYWIARIEVETLLQGHVTEFGMQTTPLDQVPGSPLH